MRKFYFLSILFSLLINFSTASAQSSSTTLDLVSWNIEWFGASFENPANDDLQRENAKKIIRYLDADIYGLVEIVDTAQVRRLVDSLGTNYGYFISNYCSNASAPGTNAWRNGQKLMFLYKKDIISNITVRGLMKNSATAYTNWASGRFPYMLTGDATINNITKTINFIVIHGKSGSTITDYDRRRGGAKELKDTLDAQYPNALNIIFGDFNDALNQTISSGAGPETSYQFIVADSTDADHYKSITLPLAYAGQTTMINFPNVIDNHVISNEVVPYYVPNSAQIRTDVTTVVPDYVSAHNTSDHYPVFSKYNLAGVITSLPNVTAEQMGLSAFPNPFNSELQIKATKSLQGVRASLVNLQGQVIRTYYFERLSRGTTMLPDIPQLSSGIYFLQVQTASQKTIIKLVHL